MSPKVLRALSFVVIGLCCMPGLAAVRDVQIRSVDFSTGVVELFNFGATDEPFDGWRFCTHDASVALQYSVTGLDGRTIEAGTSFFVHFNDDAPAGDPDRINRTAVGGRFALPLDADAYAMGLYWQSPFGTATNIADHLQWSFNGEDNLRADERSDEAEAGGVWTDQKAWIPTSADTVMIRLKDASGGLILHGPDDYDVIGASPGSGAVPDGASVPGNPLEIDRVGGSLIELTWDASCSTTDTDYEVYVGLLGDPDSLTQVTCSTGSATTVAIDVGLVAESCFYLVVPTNGTDEGSYGRDGDGAERPPALDACRPAAFGECPTSRHQTEPRLRLR